MMKPEVGPIYGVPLLDSLQLDGSSMRQALPSAADLRKVRQISERTAAGYEVVLEHYKRLQATVDKLPETLDHVRIVPGMRLLYIHPRSGTIYETGRVGLDLGHAWNNHDGRGGIHRMTWTDCYSTREAAEAAGEK